MGDFGNIEKTALLDTGRKCFGAQPSMHIELLEQHRLECTITHFAKQRQHMLHGIQDKPLLMINRIVLLIRQRWVKRYAVGEHHQACIKVRLVQRIVVHIIGEVSAGRDVTPIAVSGARVDGDNAFATSNHSSQLVMKSVGPT